MEASKRHLFQQPVGDRSYEFDIEMYNHQQTKFFIIFNHLLTFRNDENFNFQMIDFIEEMDDYSRTYFQLEESMMSKTDYTNLAFHKFQHQLFLSKIDELRIAQAYKNSLHIEKMIFFMRKWFCTHIYVLDNNYLELVKKNIIEKNTKSSIYFKDYFFIRVV